MIGFFSSLISNFLAGGSYKEELPKSRYNLVAAGDPTKIAPIAETDENLPRSFFVDSNEYKMSDFFVFQVSGNSMCPQGVENGDLLIAKKIDGTNDLHTGDFLIIEVDESIDTGKTLVYKYKLRRFLLTTNNEAIDALIGRLKEVSPEMYLDKYQTRFREKYKVAIARYPNKELVVSTTYREGAIDYSFHSSEFLRYRVVFYKRDKELNVTQMPRESNDDK